ncbi:hypothetical protein [Streptomyces sp. NPDC006739]|uniref:hypothetical protein n=1 Tax=Streptomyces sp. NPDC006739 TaxID=3364763 RepID=UPI0036AD1144
MSDVVDADELLRRIRRGRDRAEREERAWRARGVELRASDPEGSREAAVRAGAYEAVLQVLEEIVAPGGREGGTGEPGVKQVT